MSGQLNTFIDRLFQYVPEDKRAEARPIYSGLQDAVKRVGEVAQQQQAWWDANKDAVQDRDRLRAELEEARKKPAGTVDQNAIEEAIRKSQAETLDTGLGLITVATTIAANHLKEFGEALDMTAIAKQAIAAGKPLDQFYTESVAARRQERQEAALTERIEAAKKEGMELGRKEVLAATGGALPFPSPSQTVTTLSGLRKPADQQGGNLVDQAAAVALEVMARQQ